MSETYQAVEKARNRLGVRVVRLEEALLTVLDQVDYTAGACNLTDMVGACLPLEVIGLARAALKETA